MMLEPPANSDRSANVSKPRILDESFWDDPDVALLTRDERLLLVGMITLLADDDGRLLADAGYLRKRLFGYDEDLARQEVEAWRNAIVIKCRNVFMYRVKGQLYVWLANFSVYQNIRYIVASKLPEYTEESDVAHEIPENYRNFQEITEPSRRVGLSSVKEGSVVLSAENAQKTTTQPGTTNMPPEIRENMILQEHLLSGAKSLMSRGVLTKAHTNAVKTWFAKNRVNLTTEKIDYAVGQTARYTGGDKLAYLFRVLENTLAGVRGGKNGTSSAPPPDLRGPTPPQGYSWAKDDNGNWKKLGRDANGILPWGGDDMTEDDVKEKEARRRYEQSQRPSMKLPNTPARSQA